jgi:hypothetical protein
LHQVQRRNFFSGVNPALLYQILATDQAFAATIDHLQTLAPWIWDLGPRHYAVCPFRFRRKAVSQ